MSDMKKKIRFTIHNNGQIHMKTLGMTDETCFDYLALMEEILEDETIDSDYTDEFLQEYVKAEEQVTMKQQSVKDYD